MVIFNSYVGLPEGTYVIRLFDGDDPKKIIHQWERNNRSEKFGHGSENEVPINIPPKSIKDFVPSNKLPVSLAIKIHFYKGRWPFFWDIPTFFSGTCHSYTILLFHTQRPRFALSILGIAVAGAHHGDLLIGITAHGTHGVTSRKLERAWGTS